MPLPHAQRRPQPGVEPRAGISGPPASEAGLQTLERRLGEHLPAKVRALYLDRNGEQEPVLLVQLQPLQLLLETLDMLNEWFHEEAPGWHGEFPLWTDDNIFVDFLRGAA